MSSLDCTTQIERWWERECEVEEDQEIEHARDDNFIEVEDSQEIWYARSPVEQAISDMAENLPPAMELEYVAALRRYAALSNGPEPRASVCSGCGMQHKIDEDLLRFWEARYGIQMKWSTGLQCEIKPSNKKILRQEFPEVPIVVSDLFTLSNDTVQNEVSGEEVLVPRMKSIGIGYPCVSRTPLSSQAKANLDCFKKQGSDRASYQLLLPD